MNEEKEEEKEMLGEPKRYFSLIVSIRTPLYRVQSKKCKVKWKFKGIFFFSKNTVKPQ